MLEVSNSSTSIYRSCPKKYYWNYIEGLRKRRKSNALTLGTIVHNAFDMYYNKFSSEEVLDYIKNTCNEEIAKCSPSESEDMVYVKYVALGMWLYYPKDLSVFSDIKPELEFKMDLGDDVSLILRVDGLVKIDGKLWIRELKTTGLSFGQFEQRCKTSSQGSLYTWAVRKLGYPVEGVIYDFVKKPLLRKNIKEDKDQFGKRIMKSFEERPEFYYKRHYSYRSKEELLLFENDFMQTVKDLKARCVSKEWYRNPDACWMYNSACPYMPICYSKEPDKLTIEVMYDKKINPMKGVQNDKKEKASAGK